MDDLYSDTEPTEPMIRTASIKRDTRRSFKIGASQDPIARDRYGNMRVGNLGSESTLTEEDMFIAVGSDGSPTIQASITSVADKIYNQLAQGDNGQAFLQRLQEKSGGFHDHEDEPFTVEVNGDDDYLGTRLSDLTRPNPQNDDIDFDTLADRVMNGRQRIDAPVPPPAGAQQSQIARRNGSQLAAGKFRQITAETSVQPRMVEGCGGCGVSFQDSEKFCTACGKARVAPFCAGCGTRFTGSERFCGECGRKR